MSVLDGCKTKHKEVENTGLKTFYMLPKEVQRFHKYVTELKRVFLTHTTNSRVYLLSLEMQLTDRKKLILLINFEIIGPLPTY